MRLQRGREDGRCDSHKCAMDAYAQYLLAHSADILTCSLANLVRSHLAHQYYIVALYIESSLDGYFTLVLYPKKRLHNLEHSTHSHSDIVHPSTSLHSTTTQRLNLDAQTHPKLIQHTRHRGPCLATVSQLTVPSTPPTSFLLRHHLRAAPRFSPPYLFRSSVPTHPHHPLMHFPNFSIS